MAQSDAYEKGVEMRTKLYGKAAAERSKKAAYDGPIMEKFIDVALENVFGSLWTRPGLDLKTRTMVCVVSDVATGREDELAIHLRFARRHGWSEEELTEAMLHMSGYVGLPLVRGGMLVAKRVFAELQAEGDEAFS